jgi:hypothetical protein
MAYDREDLKRQALEIIDREEITTFNEIHLYMKAHRATLYTHEIDKDDDIKKAIEQQKVAIKKKMRRNWRNSDNATLQIAEFKLLSSDDELSRLNTQKVNADVNMTHKKVIFESDESGDQGQA